MSLINDVLRDLERRRGSDRRDHSSVATPISGRPRSAGRPLLGWLALAVVTGFALHWAAGERSSAPLAPVTLHASVPQPAPPATVVDRATTLETQAGEPVATFSAGQVADNRVSNPAPVPTAEPVDLPQAAVPPNHEPAPPATDTTAPKPAAETQSRIAEGERSGQPPETEPGIVIERASPSVTDARDEVDSARRDLARDRHDAAVRRLTAVLERQPDHDDARRLLAHAYIGRGQVREALRVLDEGLAQSNEPIEIARLLGHLLLERGESERARRVLGEHAPAPVDDPDFQQLLAAAHRQAGDHEAAAVSYRQLADVVPGRPAVWIGLGASLEALGDTSGAREAYGSAIEGNDPQAVQFARQRLHALNQADGDDP